MPFYDSGWEWPKGRKGRKGDECPVSGGLGVTKENLAI
jgi:hypothetical protein